jgi:acyl-CoA synthetase (AMP-forming)/AMP-acid ligase II
LLQYTSGTTGRPKGVTISQRALTSNASAIAQGLSIGGHDVGCSWLPLFHDMGLIGAVITPLCHPFEVHVLAPEAFIMRPDRWLRLISELGATISPAPNFAYELCTHRIGHVQGWQLDGWRAALNGAEAVHASTMRRFSERFEAVGFQERAMTPVYGLAESTLAVTMPTLGGPSTVKVDADALARGRVLRASGETARELVSVGTPVAGSSVRVTDESGHTLSEGAVGEIRVAGPSLMEGYFANPRASAEVLDGGWLRTGDLGAVIDGALFVVGRAKDVVVQAGRNVYPDDVERVAREVPGVRGGAVAFGVEDPARGTEALVVMVEVVRTGRACGVSKRVRGELLTVLGVRADEVVPCPLGSLSRTTSGKIQRGACKAAFEASR